MDLRSRLIAPLFRSADSGKKIFHVDAFVKRAILFDSYIIDSQGLTEVPHLIQIFGFDGFVALIEAGIVKLNCHVKHTASLGANFFLKESSSQKLRPPFHYSFTAVSTGALYHNINLSLQKIEPDIPISSRQLVRMRKAVYASLENPADDSDELSINSTRGDLVSYPVLLAKALVIAIRNQTIKISKLASNTKMISMLLLIFKSFSVLMSLLHIKLLSKLVLQLLSVMIESSK